MQKFLTYLCVFINMDCAVMNKKIIQRINLEGNSVYTYDLYSEDDLLLLPAHVQMPEILITLLEKWQINSVVAVTKEDGFRDDEATSGYTIGKNTLSATESIAELQTSKKIWKEYGQIAQQLSHILQTIIDEKTFAKDRLFEVVHHLVSMMKTHKKHILRFRTYSLHGNLPEYWMEHALKTCCLVIEFVLYTHLPYYQQVDIATAALLHNIGILQLPPQLYQKEEKTEQELKLLHAHPLLAYRTLQNLRFSATICDGVLQSKEFLDGTGFPRGLTANSISTAAQVIAACRFYTELISGMAIQSVHNNQQTYRKLIGMANKKLDSNILGTLFSFMSIFPYGSMVRLTTGNVAYTTNINTDNPYKPIVRIMSAPNSSMILDDCILVDLAQEDISIQEELAPEDARPYYDALMKEMTD